MRMMLRLSIILLICSSWPIHASELSDSSATATSQWFTKDAQGVLQIHLYFFWTRHCPHCRAARPFIEALPKRYTWIKLHSLELTDNKANTMRYIEMARSLGQEARSVPAMLYCGQMIVGYDDNQTTGAFLPLPVAWLYHVVLPNSN